MGRISKYICPTCDAVWELPLGHGMGHAMLENVLGAFAEEDEILCPHFGGGAAAIE